VKTADAAPMTWSNGKCGADCGAGDHKAPLVKHRFAETLADKNMAHPTMSHF